MCPCFGQQIGIRDRPTQSFWAVFVCRADKFAVHSNGDVCFAHGFIISYAGNLVKGPDQVFSL